MSETGPQDTAALGALTPSKRPAESGNGESATARIKVLVCGGREFNNWQFIFRTLDRLHSAHDFSAVIHGGARGADLLAKEWAISRLIAHEPYPVAQRDWNRFGKAAGPQRNQRMLDKGKPDLVVAFPGGNGTADMVARAKAAGVPVIEVSLATEGHESRSDRTVTAEGSHPVTAPNK